MEGHGRDGSVSFVCCTYAKVPWGSVLKTSKQPVGDRCEACVSLHKKAFARMEWSELLARAKSEDSFRQLVMTTREITTGRKPNNVPPEAFSEGHVSGYRVQRSFDFFSVDELETMIQRKFEETMKVKELNLPLQTIVDDGVEVSGLLLRDSTPRKVFVFTDHGTTFSRTLHKPEQTFRPSQGEEMSQWWRKDLQSTRPKCMLPGVS